MSSQQSSEEERKLLGQIDQINRDLELSDAALSASALIRIRLQDSARLVWRAVVAAWFAGFVCATAIWQVLMDLKLGPEQGQWLPWWVRGGLGLFIAAVLMLTAYVLIRAALNSCGMHVASDLTNHPRGIA